MKAVIEDWFHKYSDDLYGWAHHKTSSKEVAEDLFQETFLSAVKGLKNFQNKSNPKTWLFAILNNKIIDYYRKKAKSATVNDERLEHKYTDTTDSFFDSNQNWKITGREVYWEEEVHLLDNDEFKKVMDHCVNVLPENWRLAVISKYILGQTATEICQELKVTQSNYWQIIHRAKVMLKKCIDYNWTSSN